MVSQGVNPLVETAVAVMEIAEADETGDVVSVETEAGVIIDVIQDVDVIQGVIAKAEMTTKSVQMNAIEKPVESAPGMRTIEGHNQYDLGDIKARIETIEVKT